MRVKSNFFSLLALLIFVSVASAAAAPPKRPTPPPPTCSAWAYDFSSGINPNFWVIATGRAPGYIAGNHIGYYDPNHVTVVNGYLSILLTQVTGTVDGTNGYISYGGLIYTKATCGYGTYQWTMRMSSTSQTPNGSGAWVS